jgi:hypothetical protein
MTPDDAVLAYDADHGWHLIPSAQLDAAYGRNLDKVVDEQDQAEAADLDFAHQLLLQGYSVEHAARHARVPLKTLERSIADALRSAA